MNRIVKNHRSIDRWHDAKASSQLDGPVVLEHAQKYTTIHNWIADFVHWSNRPVVYFRHIKKKHVFSTLRVSAHFAAQPEFSWIPVSPLGLRRVLSTSKKRLRKKSQIFTLDLFAALFVFLIAGAILISMWHDFNTKLEDKSRFNNMKTTAFMASDVLVKSKGIPDKWEEDVSQLRIIGLAENDRNLSKSKIDAFISLNYSLTKELLGINPFEFYFSIKDITGRIKADDGKNSTTGLTIVVQRRVIYENEEAIMEIEIWK